MNCLLQGDLLTHLTRGFCLFYDNHGFCQKAIGEISWWFFLVLSGNILYFFIVIEFCFTINFTGVLVPWMYNTKNHASHVFICHYSNIQQCCIVIAVSASFGYSFCIYPKKLVRPVYKAVNINMLFFIWYRDLRVFEIL